MFWVMRQPTWHMRFRRDRADCGDRGLSALSALPGHRTGSFRVSPFSIVSCTPPHVPPERSVPCRFAWPLPGGRAVILFKCSRRTKRRTTQRKQNASTSTGPPRTGHVCRAHVPARRSLVSVSQRSRSRRRGTGAPGASSSAATPPPGRGRGRCAVSTGPHPRRAPAPAIRSAIGDRRGRYLERTVRAACDCPVPSVFALSSVL